MMNKIIEIEFGKCINLLPLFNAAVVGCSFCCCFVSTSRLVGKLLTSTVVDIKIEKITPKLYFKNQAILFNTERNKTKRVLKWMD